MSLGILHIIPQIAVDFKNIVYTYPIAGVGLSNYWTMNSIGESQ